jgi:hypothetical protein
VMMSLTERRGEGMDSETIRRKVRAWVAFQYLRLAILFLGWLAALHAFRLER